MEQITIRNGDDVKAFVNAQDGARRLACAAFIASRAALRGTPYALNFYEFGVKARERDLTPCVIWRPLLLSSVTAVVPTDNVTTAATAADSAFAAARADVTTASDFWAEVSRDAALWVANADQGVGTLAITIAPLWYNENQLKRYWDDLRQKLRDSDTPDDRGADWSFWIKWYDDILAGNPQNWDMLHEIAITPDIDWEASSGEVNDKISGIVEAYALKNSYYFERIEFSEAKQKLIVVPEGSFDGASVQIAYQRLRDAIEDVRDAPKVGIWIPNMPCVTKFGFWKGHWIAPPRNQYS